MTLKTETLLEPRPVELELDRQGFPNDGMMPYENGFLVLIHINKLETNEMLAWTHFSIEQFRDFVQHVETAYKRTLEEWTT